MKTKHAAAIGIAFTVMSLTAVNAGVMSGSIGEVNFGSGASPSESSVIDALEVTTYSATDKNGNSFSVALVTMTNSVLAKEVGYKFTGTGIGVGSVQRNDGKLLGKRDGNALSFQIPIFAEFEPSPNLFSTSGTKISMEYATVVVKEVSSDTLDCVVTKIDEPDADSTLRHFKMKDVSLGPGGKIDRKYTFQLKKTQNKK